MVFTGDIRGYRIRLAVFELFNVGLGMSIGI
jgi:hypothetical protein